MFCNFANDVAVAVITYSILVIQCTGLLKSLNLCFKLAYKVLTLFELGCGSYASCLPTDPLLDQQVQKQEVCTANLFVDYTSVPEAFVQNMNIFFCVPDAFVQQLARGSQCMCLVAA